MLINRLERRAIINRVRDLVQRQFEARRLLAMGGQAVEARALEVGCGHGVGIEIILDQFSAIEVDAFDLDPDMVERARKRLSKRANPIRLWVGDVTQIASADSCYDAVFDFGSIRHALDWRAAIAEIYRVLAPGGRFYAEEILRDFLSHPLWSRLLECPRSARFDACDFSRVLASVGFESVQSRTHANQMGWFVADKPA